MLSDPGIQESATAGVDTDLPPTYDALERVWRVLNRLDPIDSLEELRNGLEPLRRPPLATGALLALGFDTNALFRLGLGAQGADSLDYLRTLRVRSWCQGSPFKKSGITCSPQWSRKPRS